MSCNPFGLFTESRGLNEIQVRKEFAPDTSASHFYYFQSVLIDLIQMDYNVTQSAVTVLKKLVLETRIVPCGVSGSVSYFPVCSPGYRCGCTLSYAQDNSGYTQHHLLLEASFFTSLQDKRPVWQQGEDI